MSAGKYKFEQKPQDVSHISTEYRSIKTGIPASGTEKILESLSGCESQSMHGQMPIVWDRAEGFQVYDIAGNCWIDFTSTIFVANVGHGNAHVIETIKKFLDVPLLHSYTYATKIRELYLKKLIHFVGAPFEKSFLLSSGTEATEVAFKLMRLYGIKKQKRKLGVICFEGNWHGRTLGAQLMSGKGGQKEWADLSDPNIFHLKYPYPWRLEGMSGKEFFEKELQGLLDSGIDLSQDICGFMMETFQGWGAVFYPQDFVQAVKDVCLKNNILLAFDEMQSGFARTGTKFGYEHYGIAPDLICCGKGMGAGFPLSGVIGKAEVMDVPEAGDMSSTHSANPIACAAGLAVIEEIESKNLVAEAERKGKLLHERLQAIQEKFPTYISYTLGKGLIASIIFNHDDGQEKAAFMASRICERAMQKGLLLVYTGRESIKIGPPLIINDQALMEGLDVLEESIMEVCC